MKYKTHARFAMLIFIINIEVHPTICLQQNKIEQGQCKDHQTFSLITDSWGVSYCPAPLGGQIPAIVATPLNRSACGWFCVHLTGYCTDYTWYDDTLRCEMYNGTPPTLQLMKSVGHCWSYVDDDYSRIYEPQHAAFTATFSASKLNSYGNSIVVFPTTTTNVAGSYSTATGYFTAPQNGLYFFSVVVITSGGLWGGFNLMTSGGLVLICATGGENFQSISTAAVLRLNAWDQVWVDLPSYRPNTIYANTDSSFTGFLLAPQASAAAFSAKLSSCSSSPIIAAVVTPNMQLVLPLVQTNVGGAYNPNTGVFTAKSEGIYFFTFNFLTQTNNQAGVLLLKNINQVLISAYTNGIPNANAPLSSSSTVQLEVGDEISLFLVSGGTLWTCDSVGLADISNFAGFAIVNVAFSVSSACFSCSTPCTPLLLTNVGQAYNPSNGYFIAPMHGFYYFEFHLYAVQNGDIGLLLNGQVVARGFTSGLYGNNWSVLTSSTLLQLNTGDAMVLAALSQTSIVCADGCLYSGLSLG